MREDLELGVIQAKSLFYVFFLKRVHSKPAIIIFFSSSSFSSFLFHFLHRTLRIKFVILNIKRSNEWEIV